MQPTEPEAPSPPPVRDGASSLPPFASGAANVVVWLLVLVLGVTVLRFAKTLILPLVFAAFLAALMSRFATRLERSLRLPRVVATVISVLGLLAILGALAVTLGFAFRSIAAKTPAYVERFQQLADETARLSQEHLSFDLRAYLANSGSDWIPSPASIIQNVGGLLGVFGTLLLVLLYFSFFIHFRASLRQRFLQILRDTTRTPQDEATVDRIESTLQKYLYLKSLISFATAATIGTMSFVLGLDFVPVWVLVAFALNFIPSLGPIISVVPQVVVALFQSGPVFALTVTVVMGCIHFLSGNVIEPAVIGSRLRISFPAMIASLFLWNLIWGFPGMILAVPIMACLKVFLDEGIGPNGWRLVLSPFGVRGHAPQRETER